MQNIKDELPEILKNFGFSATVENISYGPLVTIVEVMLSKGSKLSGLEKLIKDISREMGMSGVRVSAIPDSQLIAFELPSENRKSIDFAPITQTEEFLKTSYALPICVGVDMRGKTVLRDLAKMPHLLVSGTTGSGKSVGLNSFIMSLIAKKQPSELQFVLIDPKRIEFSMYNNQRYMLRPVITDMQAASSCLKQLCDEMNKRYSLFEQQMVRNISEYHEKNLEMPYIVCIIDEFADLIMFDKGVEKQVQILAQKARAAGIHLVISTQRPSVDVITGSIKANLPTRLAYKVASPADSMTILNTTGAEDLLGKGDSLLLEENGTLTRILGVYTPDSYIIDTLKPYHCEIKEPAPYVEPKEEQSETKAVAKPEKPKVSFWVKMVDFWNRLGKRNQGKIINFILGLTAVSSAKKKRSENSNNNHVTSVKKKNQISKL